MSDTTVVHKPISFAVPPTEQEQLAWDALSREEQVNQLREVFASKEANTVSTVSVEDILQAVRSRLRSEG